MTETNERIAILGVDYKDFQPETYNGVTVDFDGSGFHKFNTGDFNVDYEDASELANEKANKVFHSSSVDDFIADSKYD